MSPHFKHCLFGSLIMSLLLASGLSSAQKIHDNPDPTGNISLYFENGALQCTFPAQTSQIGFVEENVHGDRCKFLEKGAYFQLRNVPSATTFWLVNSKRHKDWAVTVPSPCDRGSGTYPSEIYSWWELKTIKEPTTMTEAVRVQDLDTKVIGDVVVPGVRLTGRFVNSNMTPVDENRITCIMMEVSQ